MDISNETIIEAIKGSDGIVNNIAKRLNVCWTTANKYINQSEETKKAFTDARESLLDDLEDKATSLARNGSENMIKLYLNTIGKKRGFTEKTEIEHSGNIDIKEIVIKVAE